MGPLQALSFSSKKEKIDEFIKHNYSLKYVRYGTTTSNAQNQLVFYGFTGAIVSSRKQNETYKNL